jgi:glucosamine-6-phosphate deaminase
VHIPNGNASDFKRECQEYEEKIRKAGGIELFVGGKFFTFCDNFSREM